uniref:Uncharacterized protein n=1 Tax=Knipowitschia caucasica TaxID=637954 RepID=A0AAV2JHH1_KNICA
MSPTAAQKVNPATEEMEGHITLRRTIPFKVPAIGKQPDPPGSEVDRPARFRARAAWFRGRPVGLRGVNTSISCVGSPIVLPILQRR